MNFHTELLNAHLKPDTAVMKLYDFPVKNFWKILQKGHTITTDDVISFTNWDSGTEGRF